MKFDVGIRNSYGITYYGDLLYIIGDYIKIVLKIERDNYKFVLRGLVLPRGSFGFALTHYTELRRVLTESNSSCATFSNRRKPLIQTPFLSNRKPAKAKDSQVIQVNKSSPQIVSHTSQYLNLKVKK